jgi:CSLREA domain-containing protein
MSRRVSACVVLGIGVFLHATAHATTRTVTTTADHAIGPCTADDCTLREAVVSSLDGDLINFAPSLTGTITLTQGEMLIQQSITIIGPGAKVLSVSGNNVTRIFEITKGFTASISGLTLMSGYVDNAGATETIREGGAVLNHGTLTVAECRFTLNAVKAFAVDRGSFIEGPRGRRRVGERC